MGERETWIPIVTTTDTPGVYRCYSEHDPEKYYSVDAHTWTCTCRAFRFTGVCKHIPEVQARHSLRKG
jgi:hypothetical protein